MGVVVQFPHSASVDTHWGVAGSLLLGLGGSSVPLRLLLNTLARKGMSAFCDCSPMTSTATDLAKGWTCPPSDFAGVSEAPVSTVSFAWSRIVFHLATLFLSWSFSSKEKTFVGAVYCLCLWVFLGCSLKWFIRVTLKSLSDNSDI